MSTQLYIGNIDYKTNENDLRKLLEEFGVVTSIKIVCDKETGKPKGFAFAEMSDEKDGEEAVIHLNDKDVHGRKIKVSFAKPRR